ncbi:MAG: hypothetical protein QXD45_04990 [Candidatus Bathyarchaeia archaeon]
MNFALWLKRRGGRGATIRRKIRTLKSLKGSPEEMIREVFSEDWCDKNKEYAMDAVCQYVEFLGLHLEKPKFRVYDSKEMFVTKPRDG